MRPGAVTTATAPHPSTGTSLFLDGLPAPTFAASFQERLLTSWTGSLARARRTTGGTEQDIGYDGSNVLDQSALSTFGNTSSATWKTLYDQSGNTRDFTQSTAGNQPRAYTGGSPGTIFKDSTHVFSDHGVTFTNNVMTQASTLGLSGAANLTILLIWKHIARAPENQQAIITIGPNGNDITLLLNESSSPSTLEVWRSNDASHRIYTTGVSGLTTYHYAVVTVAGNTNTVAWRQNGSAYTATTTTAGALNISGASSCLAAYDSGGTGSLRGGISTVAVWNSVLSGSDLSTLESRAATRI